MNPISPSCQMGIYCYLEYEKKGVPLPLTAAESATFAATGRFDYRDFERGLALGRNGYGYVGKRDGTFNAVKL